MMPVPLPVDREPTPTRELYTGALLLILRDLRRRFAQVPDPFPRKGRLAYRTKDIQIWINQIEAAYAALGWLPEDGTGKLLDLASYDRAAWTRKARPAIAKAVARMQLRLAHPVTRILYNSATIRLLDLHLEALEYRLKREESGL